MKKITVLLVDDHAVLRAGLRALIDAQSDMEVVAEAANGVEAIRKTRESRPDVALLDLTMPQMPGLQALPRMRQVSQRTRVLVLSMHDDPAYAQAALASGAAGYIVKQVESAELLSAIRAVHGGRTVLDVSRSAGAKVVGERVPARTESLKRLLSSREWSVLELVAYGYTHREIAARLSVSVKTVETYRARIGEKLGLRPRAEIVRFALEVGLLGPGREGSGGTTSFPFIENGARDR